MRATFFNKLCEIAGSDERLVFLTADLGFGAVEKYVTQLLALY